VAAEGNPYEFTSQLYFTEELKTEYPATEPYAGKGTTNATAAADFTIGPDLSDTEAGDDDSPGPWQENR
jgi:hypothetical protein